MCDPLWFSPFAQQGSGSLLKTIRRLEMNTRDKHDADGNVNQDVDRTRLMLIGGLFASGCLLANPVEVFGQENNDGPASHLLALNLGKMHEQIEVPATISITQLKRDCEQILAILAKSPNDVQDFVAKVHGGDHQGARKIVERIGLTEEAFSSKGGGFWHLLLLAAAAYLIHRFAGK
jgi:hypothetical protein